mmetsp:Transcript_27552/g.92126  ORF Transcript_27552/g.92126 Transcript_27552/m.92126 type:complete len:234 (-) Transcript_27552:94-795(-)
MCRRRSCPDRLQQGAMPEIQITRPGSDAKRGKRMHRAMRAGQSRPTAAVSNRERSMMWLGTSVGGDVRAPSPWRGRFGPGSGRSRMGLWVVSARRELWRPPPSMHFSRCGAKRCADTFFPQWEHLKLSTATVRGLVPKTSRPGAVDTHSSAILWSLAPMATAKRASKSSFPRGGGSCTAVPWSSAPHSKHSAPAQRRSCNGAHTSRTRSSTRSSSTAAACAPAVAMATSCALR